MKTLLLIRQLKRAKYKTIIGIFVFLLFFMHFYAFPKFTKSYTDPCYLTKPKYNALNHILHTLAIVLENLNETYWLDYGTLMGFYRDKTVSLYDSDIDLSRIMHMDQKKEKLFYEKFHYEMNKHDVEVIKNGTMLRKRTSEGEYVFGDLMVWKQSLMLSVAKKIGAGDIPKVWILPPKKVNLKSGQMVYVPFNYDRVIRFRYPFSWRIRFPYKWKCWIPWNYPSD